MKAARRTATALETAATALWVGASAGFAFISAPLAFTLVRDRDVFGELTERSLARLATLTYVTAGTAVTIALGRAGFEHRGRASDVLRALAGAGAIAAITFHQRAIVPAMTRAQAAMGGFSAVSPDDPKRLAYRALHRRSTRTYGTALLLGSAQLVLAATRSNADDAPA